MDLKHNKNKFVDLKKIKTLCRQKHMSFAELGRKIGLENRESISRRLLNQYTITADELFLIAEKLGVSTDELKIS